MDAIEQALQTQLNNIEQKTGKSLTELTALVEASGLDKHGQIRDMLKRDLRLGHGDANTLTHYARRVIESRSAEPTPLPAPTDILDVIYSGPKAALRPIHDKLMAAIDQFGEFEIAPKQKYVSLRCKRQFAMLGPATNTRFELGLNHKDLIGDDRLIAQPPGSMCHFIVKLTNADQVDDTIIGWVRQAYDEAG